MKHGAFLRGLGGLVAAYVGAFVFASAGIEQTLARAILGGGNFDEEWAATYGLFYSILDMFKTGYGATLLFATVAMPVALLLRFLWRARVRAHYSDPTEKARAYLKDRPGIVGAFLTLPPLLWTFFTYGHLDMSERSRTFEALLVGFMAPAFVVFGVQYLLVRGGLRALVAPLIAHDADRSAEGFTFQAVAVTRQTRAMVGGVAALSAAMLGLVYSLKVGTMVHNHAFHATLIGYLALAVGIAVFFVRASRISVGLDGVYISGTARARFVSYRDIDAVEIDGNSLVLMKGPDHVLRLQLHGDDALRRAALAERIRGAIKQAVTQRVDNAVAFVDKANVEEIERAAAGAASYRQIAPSREKLWEMLDSPALDAKGRSAAATALAKSCTSEEYERLVVMAENCAEPSVRTHLRSLVAELEEFAQEGTAKPSSHRKMSLDATK